MHYHADEGEKRNMARAGLLLVLVAAPAALAAQGRTVTAVATVRQLCQGMITTSSDELFNVGREAPADDGDWLAVQNHAIMLAESGNLLMIGSRVRDTEDWMTMSQALVDAGVAALEAVEARDVDGLLAAGDLIVTACETCHVPYRDGGLSMPVR